MVTVKSTEKNAQNKILKWFRRFALLLLSLIIFVGYKKSVMTKVVKMSTF